jgi:NAD(P)-dependent dehydrogenase (short-subunit alcohol dehydrogenase family)
MEPLAKLGVETLIVDVANSKSIKDLKAKVTSLTGGKLDILINNA